MLIHHKNPAANGIHVIACRAYHFRNGVAEADLNGAEQAALFASGHRIEQELVVEPERKPRRKQPVQAAPPEVGTDAEITEETPPEIG